MNQRAGNGGRLWLYSVTFRSLFLRGDRSERMPFVDKPKTKVDLQIQIVKSAWTVYFADLWQHLTLSVLAHFQNGYQQKTSNTDDERVSKFQRQSLHKPCNIDFCGNFVTLLCDAFS